MTHLLASFLSLASALVAAPTALAAQDPRAPQPPPVVGTADPAKPGVPDFADADPRPYTVEESREPLTEFDGFTSVIRVTNTSAEPLVLRRVELFGGAGIHIGGFAPSMNVLHLPLAARAASADALAWSVTPLPTDARGHTVMAAATVDRRVAVVAAVLSADPASTELRMHATDESDVALYASVPGPSEPLAPGATWTSPKLLCLQQGDALFVLDHVLEQLAGAPSAPLTADVASEFAALAAKDPAAAEAAFAPFVRVPRAGDGSNGERTTWMRNLAALPLDAFDAAARARRYDLGHVTRGDGSGAERVFVVNPTADPALVRVRFVELGLDPSRRWRVLDATTDADLGVFEESATLPLAARARVVLDVTSTGEPASGVFKYALVEPDLAGKSTVVSLTPGASDAAERLERAFQRGGILIAHHVGSAVLEPPAALIEMGLDLRIVPSRPRAVRPPTTTAERRFAERASNVEWAMRFETRPSKAALLCLEAGFGACPLGATLADGIPAARGFVAPVGGGLIILLMDQDEAAVAALAERLCSADERRALATTLAPAQRTVFAAAPKRGLFARLDLPRVQREDFVPADPAFAISFSAFAIGPRRASTLRDDRDEPLTELVRGLARPLTFVLDVPVREPDEDVVLVVRRPPLAPFSSYTLFVDSTPLREVLPDAGPIDRWREDTIVLPGATIGERSRVALTLAGSGSMIEVARIGIFRVDTDQGLELATFVPTAGSPRRVVAGMDEPLHAHARSFLTGIALEAGTEVQYDLSSGMRAFRATATAAYGSAPVVLRVLVDGVERWSSDSALEPTQLEAISLNLRGAKALTLRAEPAPGAAGDSLATVVLGDARVFQ